MKRITKPMGREDWAWLLACVVCGLFIAGLAILPEISNGAPRHVSKFNFNTGVWDESVAPAYERRVTIETNGDVQKMIQAAHDIDPDCWSLISADHPKLTSSDYFQIFTGALLAVIMFSYLFRVLEKICRRILQVKVPTDEIVRDTSTPLRSAQDDGLKI